MDPKNIPKASPQSVARQNRIIGLAAVAGATAIYFMIKKSDETNPDVATEKVESAGSKVKEAAGDAKDAAQEAANDAKAKASNAVDDAKAKASNAVDDAKKNISKKVDEAKQKAGDKVEDAGKSIKK